MELKNEVTFFDHNYHLRFLDGVNTAEMHDIHPKCLQILR